MTLAEIPYPRIDPILLRIGGFSLRWYGVSYVIAFGLAFLVLRMLAKRGRWPVAPGRVGDVLFWGILGVFLGGRFGYMLFYAEDKSITQWWRVWDGGMAFHGGLIGVVTAYFVYGIVKGIPFRFIGDGLALATPLGIFCVRMANFVNAELVGRVSDGPFAMNFPTYHLTKDWDGAYETDAAHHAVYRHPSQLYQGLTEGLLLFFVLRWLMLSKRWGGGTIGCMFLVGYGTFRFFTEYFREPDPQLGYLVLGMTRGQEFCASMIVLGLGCLVWMVRTKKPTPMLADVLDAPEPPLFPRP